MHPNVYPSAEQIKYFLNERGVQFNEANLKDSTLEDSLVDVFWKEKTNEIQEAKAKIYKDWTKKADAPSEKEFWFDFIADSGDGQMAVYNVAYLCLSDLWRKEKSDEDSQDELQVSAHPPKESEKSSWKMLPRGSFLFVGGDTSYHVSDYATNSQRFQLPFRWAFASVRKFYDKTFSANDKPNPDGTIENKETPELLDAEPARPIFAVPANHDYYDGIDGFNRQFRRPKTPEHLKDDPTPPQLSILGFERKQQASYMALRLPFGWWLWGIDSELNKIDFRQECFFKELNDREVPKKIIVATPEPTTFFGRKPLKVESPDDEDKTARYFRILGLERPFMDEDLKEGTCRLDISGDVHNYERYWGAKNESGPENGNAPNMDYYSSMVAGGGGAFVHPSHTFYKGGADKGGVKAKVVYPNAKASNNAFAERLFDIYNIWKGGYVWLIGAIMAGIIFFTLTLPQDTRKLFDGLFFGDYFKLPIPSFLEDLCPCSEATMYAPMYNIHFILLAVFLIASVVFLLFGRNAFGKAITQVKSKSLSEIKRASPDSFYLFQALPPKMQFLCLLVFALAIVFFLMYVFYLQYAWASINKVHSFSQHLLALLHLIGSLLTFALSSQYSNFLDCVYKGSTKTDRKFQKFFYLPMWALNIIALAVLLLGFGIFARQAAVCVLSDVLLWTISLGALLGLFYFGYGVGSDLQPNQFGKIWLGVLGAFHAVLQLLIPVLYVRVGSWTALLILALSVAVISAFGKYSLGSLAMKKFPKALVVFWFVYGLALLALPFYLPHLQRSGAYNNSAEWSFFGSAALAILLGGVMSMVWLGWYLAVALGFNGHNNEAGGAGRLEKFRHIVRICLTQDNLSVYVIAFDDPNKEGEALRLRLIDNFALSVKQSSST
jgi:hypothetical protein